MNKTFVVHANQNMVIALFAAGSLLLLGSFFSTFNITLFLICLSFYIIPILFVNTKITLKENKLIHKSFFIGKELDLNIVKEITIRNSYMFRGGEGDVAGSTEDILFLDREGEELYRINLGNGSYYNNDEVQELIKRLKERIKINDEQDNSFIFA
jgi:hypothetical protein